MLSKEEINENIKQRLLPCGCEIKKCTCKMNALEYAMTYPEHMGIMLKGHKIKIIKSPWTLIKGAFNQIKIFFKFMFSKK